jgi:hypothetical protein
VPCIVANPDTTAQGHGRCVVALPRQFAIALAATMTKPPTGILGSCMASLGHLHPPAARQAINATAFIVGNESLPAMGLQWPCTLCAQTSAWQLHAQWVYPLFLNFGVAQTGISDVWKGWFGIGYRLSLVTASNCLVTVHWSRREARARQK